MFSGIIIISFFAMHALLLFDKLQLPTITACSELNDVTGDLSRIVFPKNRGLDCFSVKDLGHLSIYRQSHSVKDDVRT